MLLFEYQYEITIIAPIRNSMLLFEYQYEIAIIAPIRNSMILFANSKRYEISNNSINISMR